MRYPHGTHVVPMGYCTGTHPRSGPQAPPASSSPPTPPPKAPPPAPQPNPRTLLLLQPPAQPPQATGPASTAAQVSPFHRFRF